MGMPSMVWRDVWNDVRTTEAGHIGAWGVVTRTRSGRREVCTLDVQLGVATVNRLGSL